MSADEAIHEGLPEVEPAPPRRMPLRWPRGTNWITWVCASICLSVGVDVMQMFAELDKALALADVRAGGAIERYLRAHQLSTLLSILLLVLFIASSAITLRWLYLTYRNLFGLQVTALTYTPIDAIKTCFLPTSWLYLPYRIIQEIWRASDPALPSGSSEWKAYSGDWLIRIWWLLFLGRFLRISISINPFPDNPALVTVLQVAAWCTAISAAMGAIAGALFVIILLRIERRQWQRYDRLQW